MYVTGLQLVDFRSYHEVEIDLDAGVTVFVGPNGQGKINLVEAVEYVSTLGSHRVSSDAPLVRAGAEQAVVRARVAAGLDDPRKLLLEVEINPGRSNRARINRSPQKRAHDLLGVLRSVTFTPDDLAIVKGDPSDRRTFLDSLVVSRWPRLSGVKLDYDRVLKQRNMLLKSMAAQRAGRGVGDEGATLQIWSEQLARFGAEMLDARLDTLFDLMPFASASYAQIAPVNNATSACYRTSLELRDERPDEQGLAELLLAAMQARRGEEIARGVSLVGPHRDDITLGIGELPAKGYASHGESWSLALALRLGSFALLRADGIEPVLILDDVFAELDTTRRDRLAGAVLDAEQVLVTAAVESDLPPQLGGNRFHVGLGRVWPYGSEEPSAPTEGADSDD